MRSNPNPYLFSHLNEDERKYARNEKVSYFLELTSKQDDLSIHLDLYLRDYLRIWLTLDFLKL